MTQIDADDELGYGFLESVSQELWNVNSLSMRFRIRASMPCRLLRKAFAQKFLFGKPRLRKFLQSWLCLTMHRGPVLGCQKQFTNGGRAMAGLPVGGLCCKPV